MQFLCEAFGPLLASSELRCLDSQEILLSMRWNHLLYGWLLCWLLAGCGGTEETTPVRSRYVRVDWLGYETFVITSSIGKKVLTNPYAPGTTGRVLPRGLRPDVLLVSSEQSDANFVDAFDNSPTTFRGAIGIGTNNAAGLRIRGIPTYSNPEASSGEFNLIFAWSLEGMRFCYLGNIQRRLTSAQAQQVGPVDVLFMPVGVPAALTDDERLTIVRPVASTHDPSDGPIRSIFRLCEPISRKFTVRARRRSCSPRRSCPSSQMVVVF